MRTLSILAAAAIALTAHAQTTRNVPAQYPHIQDAIAASANGDTVLVAAGVYRENLDFLGKAITVTTSGGAAVTTIDGSAQAAATVSFTHGELRSSVLSGFTIANGDAPQGGVYISGAAPTLAHNIFRNNACNSVNIVNGAPLLDTNDITTTQTGSSCTNSGAAVSLTGSPSGALASLYPTLTGNTIEYNTLGTNAGAIAGAGFLATGNIIHDNAAGTGSVIGGLSLGASFTFAGNLVYNNTSNNTGFYHAALDLDNGGYPGGNGSGVKTVFIDNNTFVNNTVGTGFSYATDLYLGYSANVALVNNIFSSGSLAYPPIYCFPGTATSVDDVFAADHNDIYNPSGGSSAAGSCAPQIGAFGNIAADPRFSNAGGYDFNLAIDSPAIDAGDNSYAVNYYPPPPYTTPPPPSPLLTTDLNGQPRLRDTTSKGYAVIDMGAYEFQQGGQTPETLLELYPSTYDASGGTASTLYAQLSSTLGTPSGTVTFFADGKSFATTAANSNGLAIASGVFTPGAHAMVAQYAGAGSFSPAVSQPFYLLVDKYTPTLTLTSSAPNAIQGQPVTFTLAIQAADTNALSPLYLYDNSGATLLQQFTPDATGVVTYTTSALTPSTHNITAYFPGDNAHVSVRAALTQTIAASTGTPTTTTVGVNPTYAPLNTPITLTASVSPANATGTLTFYDGANPFTFGPVVNGVTTLTYSAFTAGTHLISAAFATADPTTYAPSTSGPITLTVAAAPVPIATTTTLIGSPLSSYVGDSVSLTATVTPGAPTGSLVITDNGVTLLTQLVVTNGTLNVAVSSFTAGQHTLVATYVPSDPTAYAPSTSGPITLTVAPRPSMDFTFTPEATNLTVATAHHIATTLTLTSVNNFSGPITLTCGTLPPVLTCELPTQPIPLAANGTAQVALTLDTDAILNFATFLPLSLLALLTRKRRRQLALLTLALLAATLTACGGHQPASTPPGVYNIILTAASGAQQHTATVTLHVTP